MLTKLIKGPTYNVSVCEGFEGCPLSWATQRSDSDGGAASAPGMIGAPVSLSGSYRGEYNMGQVVEHSDPYYVQPFN
eukprot:CAMPEP_0173377106 /NCGR_PEP_ID=MMETSP1356-20130122/298_1 /TAXON_ID=77927 ORGANISM="Hemiselmis virescens, Strain PCC157" /NCGR_SAMPLE_ID=MMETSP1356 /ASSEMBLY_ACC=CAM_ASM_000847 /LENGTH=76 /DNA_ID=CAMNT_0014329721 /DNA_START=37 /DNA_END=267 /DNA_ORIENTATION=-